MYKKILFAISFGIASLTATYASFPVERENATTQTTVVSENSSSIENKQMVKEETNANKQSSPATSSPSGKSQLIALILCGLVGIVGIHRFYLGYITQGILQILTFGGCGIWTLIDLIRIVTGDLKPKGGDYAEKL